MAQDAIETQHLNEPLPLATDANSNSEEARRERSTIEFPYVDLDDVVALAKAVHARGGFSCQIDQLAAELGQSAASSGFRQRLSAARVYQVASQNQGVVSLLPIGIKLTDPEQEPAARADAFMAVPLYKRIYEKFKGTTLPPNVGLESSMADLGVAQKQKDKARQVFQRAAAQGGFFAHGNTRLVPPSFKTTIEAQPESEKLIDKTEPKCGDGGGGGFECDPAIAGLIKRLPKPDTQWPLEKQARWLLAVARAFEVVYPRDDDDGRSLKVEVVKE